MGVRATAAAGNSALEEAPVFIERACIDQRGWRVMTGWTC